MSSTCCAQSFSWGWNGAGDALAFCPVSSETAFPQSSVFEAATNNDSCRDKEILPRSSAGERVGEDPHGDTDDSSPRALRGNGVFREAPGIQPKGRGRWARARSRPQREASSPRLLAASRQPPAAAPRSSCKHLIRLMHSAQAENSIYHSYSDEFPLR